MARAGQGRGRLIPKRAWKIAGGVAVAGFAGWAVLSTSHAAAAIGHDALHALWLLPALMGLHLTQLLLSAQAWRILIDACHAPPNARRLAAFWRLRVMREGIDALLPVAQIGGEVVAARVLVRRGVAIAPAAASLVVDLTLEFASQLAFLMLGLAALAVAAPDGAWRGWIGIGLLTSAGVAGFLLAQRLGALRALEWLGRVIAARWPALGIASLDGLHLAATAIYRNSGATLGSGALHLVAWLLGTAESWAVLQALGLPVTVLDALVVESLGMAARSAGFAIPGALVVQETGFVLAASAAGLPQTAGLTLSLVKRVREVAVGLIGLALWRYTARQDTKTD